MIQAAIEMPDTSTVEGTIFDHAVIRDTQIRLCLDEGLSTHRIKKLVKCSSESVKAVRYGEKTGSADLAALLKEGQADRYNIASSVFLHKAMDKDKLANDIMKMGFTPRGLSPFERLLLTHSKTNDR